jgi:hypothetical protein
MLWGTLPTSLPGSYCGARCQLLPTCLLGSGTLATCPTFSPRTYLPAWLRHVGNVPHNLSAPTAIQMPP